MRIRGPFCALIEMGPGPLRGKPKTDKNENVITVWEIDESSDLTVFRINNLEWMQKGMNSPNVGLELRIRREDGLTGVKVSS